MEIFKETAKLELTNKKNSLASLLSLADKNSDLYNLILGLFTRSFYKVKKEYAEIGFARLLKMYEAGTSISDKTITESVYEWYFSLPNNAFNEEISDNNTFVKQKAKTIENIFTKANILLPKNTKKLLLDIGCGDGSLSFYLKEALELEQIHGLDVSTEVIYGENFDFRKEPGFVYKDYSKKTLKEALRDDFESQKYDLVTYSHSLHHFGFIKKPKDKNKIATDDNSIAEKKNFKIKYVVSSLKQAIEALNPGGILLITEHAHELDTVLLNLFHIFINMGCLLANQKKPKKNEFVKEVMDFHEEISSIKYLSGSFIKHIAQYFGLKLIMEKRRDSIQFDDKKAVEKDTTNSTFFVFRKHVEGELRHDDGNTCKSNVRFFSSSLSQDDSIIDTKSFIAEEGSNKPIHQSAEKQKNRTEYSRLPELRPNR